MFYDKFLDLCAQKGVSNTAACVNAGISENAWKRWVTGGSPNSATMRKLSKYFGVPVQSMYGDETPKIGVDDQLKAREDAFERTEIRALFDVAQKAPASKIYEAIAMLQKFVEESGASDS